MLPKKLFCFVKVTLYIAAAMSSSTLSYAANIVYIDSYHSDYSWSEETYGSFQKNIPNDAVTHVFYLDSKRNPSEESIKAKAEIILKKIELVKPDVIVAADDNSSKYIIEPHFKNAEVPVVFLGVNVDPSVYKYPYQNTTGVIESYSYARFSKIQSIFFKDRMPVYIFANTTTGKRKFNKHKEMAGDEYPVIMVDSMQEFTDTMNTYNSSSTIFVLDNLWGMAGFNSENVRHFVESKKNVLVASITESNRSFSHLIFKQSALEQGGKAGLMVTQLLQGKSVSEIKIKYGVMFRFIINRELFEVTHTPIPSGIGRLSTKLIE